jgi:hypothetical protein
MKVEYQPGFGCVPQMPRYVEREIEQQVIRLHDASEIKFFEQDRDGNERYEDFRYYDAEEWGGIVAWMDNRDGDE